MQKNLLGHWWGVLLQWQHTSYSVFCVSAGMPPQSMAPQQRPPLKSLHSNSEEIQDDFDWDSLLS